jgi:hypothetical protein
MRIDLAEQLVTQLRFDFAVSLLTLQGTVVRVQSDFVVGHPGQEPVPVSIEDLAPGTGAVMQLFGQVLVAAEATDDGALHLFFESGARMHVMPDDTFEPWSLNSGTGELLIGLPGGGSAVYR